MQWPSDIPVPEYFVRGMSFDDLLTTYRKYTKTKAELLVDEEGDTQMIGQKSAKARSALGINKKAKSGGIEKAKIHNPHKGPSKPGLYDSKRPKGVVVSVKNIPFATTDMELKEHFSHLGHILQAKVDRDKNNKSRGSGTITFSSRNEAEIVVESMQQTCIGDRVIRVLLAG
jgi:hypothetical protein